MTQNISPQKLLQLTTSKRGFRRPKPKSPSVTRKDSLNLKQTQKQEIKANLTENEKNQEQEKIIQEELKRKEEEAKKKEAEDKLLELKRIEFLKKEEERKREIEKQKELNRKKKAEERKKKEEQEKKKKEAETLKKLEEQKRANSTDKIQNPEDLPGEIEDSYKDQETNLTEYIPKDVEDQEKKIDTKIFLKEDPEIDRSEWVSNVMSRNPGIENLYQRLNPLSRAQNFCYLFNPGFAEVREKLTKEMLLQIIMQHFMCLGFRKTKAILEEESKVKYEPHYLKDSRLQTLLRISLQKIDYIWELTQLKTRTEQENEERATKLAEHFTSLGLEDEDEDEQEDDIYFWKEPPDSNIIYQEDKDTGEQKKIKAASLNKLVERLTHEQEHSLPYLETFLMTYQSFTTPKMLLRKLIQRWHVPKSKNMADEIFRPKKRSIQLRVCNVIKNWIEKHYSDFQTKLKKEMLDFIENTIATDGHVSLSNQLKNLLLSGPKTTVQIKQSGNNVKSFEDQKLTAPEPKVPKNIFSPTLSLFDVDEEEIARQLTIREFSIYSAIKPPELLNQAWSKAKYKHRATNVLMLINRFNEVSAWVATTIAKADRIRVRVKVLSKFIRLCEHLNELNNFNTLMAVLAGINNSAIYRLKHTWEDLPKRFQDSFAELSKKMASDSSYKNLREALMQVNPPCIPYLGVYLTDITFIEDGNPDKIDNLINFYKRVLVSKVIINLQQYQQMGYNFQPVHQIQILFQKFQKWDDAEIYKKSLLIEPRNTDRSEIL
ncbi:ras guanine nucleotide exchange factor i-related [Anaeramoeba ignava]|uniref:Ras guanine nucleotide exchange factor i-related n=1 Tax=Anaeramoeba ignava TaxID=1746090 RepID=A0A9Q0RDP6_ANAIG|nr:ras guanine nucleotide exchange factor i-related [Anaeramoeba ignava]